MLNQSLIGYSFRVDTGASQKVGERMFLTEERSRQARISAQAAHQRRGTADCGEYRKAAGAVEEILNLRSAIFVTLRPIATAVVSLDVL